MSRRERSCCAFIDGVAHFLEQELPEAELPYFEAHLAACPDCATYLDGYRKTVELQGRAFDPDAPGREPVPEALVAAILMSRRQARRPQLG